MAFCGFILCNNCIDNKKIKIADNIYVTTCQRGTVFNGHCVLQNNIKTRHNCVCYSVIVTITFYDIRVGLS
jgi:hypothetical protein